MGVARNRQTTVQVTSVTVCATCLVLTRVCINNPALGICSDNKIREAPECRDHSNTPGNLSAAGAHSQTVRASNLYGPRKKRKKFTYVKMSVDGRGE